MLSILPLMDLSCMNFQKCKAKQHGAEKRTKKIHLITNRIEIVNISSHSYYSAVYGYFKSLQGKQWYRLSP